MEQHKTVKNFQHIQAEIQQLFKDYYLEYRPQKTPVHIIVVTKNRTQEDIYPLLKAGHRIFGENKVPEAQEKWHDFKQEFPDIELHFIGHLQSNKVKKALELFDVIQTIDRKDIADHIVKYQDIIKPHQRFFMQINIGAEPQKSGVMVDEFSELLTYCKNQNLDISGLMCIPPKDKSPLHYFAMMQSLARQNGNLQLSAGMSSDYHKAILCGANYIRIGSAIFA